jgi:monoamine oxidase
VADVAVLGGGLAGLAAAVTLARAGVDARLLEAEQRVGGRVLTLREPFADGLYAEAGGEFISAGHRTVHEFLEMYGIPTQPTPGGARLMAFEGRVARGAWLEDLGPVEWADAERILERTAELAGGIADPDRPWQTPDAAALDARSLGDWLDELGLSPISRAFQEVWVTVDYAVPPDEISLLQYARDERLIQLAPEGAGARAVGGTDRLTAAMVAELGDRVHLGTRAIGLHQGTGGVSIRYDRGGTSGSLGARFAVLALPARAVRRLATEPSLDSEQVRALDELAYGVVTKVFLQFRRRFWREQGLNGSLFTDRPIQATYEATYGQSGERGILTVYTADRAAESLAALPEDRRIAYCLEELDRLYPGCSAEFEVGTSSVWTGTSGSPAAYSHFRPGQLTRFGPLLARPAGRIHFAGEHTDPWQAMMNGALRSGVRAAREVLVRLSR